MAKLIVWQAGLLLATAIAQSTLPIEGAIATTFIPPGDPAPKETQSGSSRLWDDERGSGRKQATADDTSTVCTDRFGKFVPCSKVAIAAKNKEEPKRCRRPGEIQPQLPRCPIITSLPE